MSGVPVSPTARNLAILAARDAGRSLRSIGEEWGVSPTTIRYIVERMQRQRSYIPPEDWTLETPLNTTGPSSRIRNMYLAEGEAATVADLLTYAEVDLLCMPNVGRKSVRDIQAALALHGWTLAPFSRRFAKTMVMLRCVSCGNLSPVSLIQALRPRCLHCRCDLTKARPVAVTMDDTASVLGSVPGAADRP